MVFQIIIDMRHFLYILLIALFAASSAFYALLHHFDPSDGDAGNPFRSPGHTLFFMFNMLLLGDFDMASFVFGEYEVLVQVLFVLSMMFTLIILLNLLIALMSDSYERIQVFLLSSDVTDMTFTGSIQTGRAGAPCSSSPVFRSIFLSRRSLES